MAKDPAFLLYYKDILVSCADWDGDEIGWYTRLLCHQADKQEGLPKGLEELASLAGVKFSQFERFVSCWKRTLSAKFEENSEGLLINKVQDANLEKRRQFKEKQMKRGLVGAYVKKAKTARVWTAYQLTDLTMLLFDALKIENSKEENEQAYKRTLEAFIGNANAIGNVNTDEFKKEKRPDEKIELPQYGFFSDQLDQDIELPELEVGKTIEFIRLKHRKILTHGEVQDQWKAFKIQQTTEHKWYNDFAGLITHFRNAVNSEITKNGTGSNRATASGKSKLGTSTDREKAAQEF